MKISALLILVLSNTCFAEGIYAGYQLSAFSRGGFIIGYDFDNSNAVEFHLNGSDFGTTYGVSYKRHYSEMDYLVVGYTTLNYYNYDSDSRTNVYGLNMGVGHEFGRREEGEWSYPIEIGGGPGYEPAESKWRPLVFFGIGALYN
ncbi:hypothetical protein [Gynuella sunshinyii]|uniref:Outer membrane protein beta-barrel domain-containing protein n=1 Tax=Gynuella sunshinyii YC6258 TaxID=1445510 RepID=A0A0C5V7Q6_9GAMM|nr:hypothetical protein [Gynuella sunshinyii]AJQ95455.1 hypothetical Protein YC6258_03419 [Gynuella sunshinyii YC6258]